MEYSSATIRNEMAELEKLGLLDKPHTSAGRVPSEKGYRYYVDELMQDNELTLEEIQYIQKQLETKVDEMEDFNKNCNKYIIRINTLYYSSNRSNTNNAVYRWNKICSIRLKNAYGSYYDGYRNG